ncbi:hypothetical protein [Ureibacillus terrenus]|uniref:Uncharacterized protein n=1 Tax=Ureibacillus terrenus TaxID=118246 RepID=A0A540UV86_9BACL|nr:hypothetical protein [Ureibacillus terrenus]MED3662065.1 hypothetical protein [Ureibacillus terrenus]MED3765185.1 hypothetical protein [Ureibacillus terrenus]TQE88395.1 hypothetical protein FKZ59_13900 [Ureibacillus terrenus]
MRIADYLASLKREDLWFVVELIALADEDPFAGDEFEFDLFPSYVIAETFSILGDLHVHLEKGLEKLMTN